jgi:hypothetical protein
MRKPALIFTLTLAICTHALCAARYWVGLASNGGAWNNTANWSASSGGTGGASVPTSTDDVFFDIAASDCTLSGNVTVQSIQMSGTFSGSIQAGTYTINVVYNFISSSTFNKGSVIGTGAMSFNLGSPFSSITFSGTTFSIPVNGNSGRILFNGSVFNSTVTLTKTGGVIDNSTGGNTFNGAVNLSNNCSSSTNELRLGIVNLDKFNNDVSISTSNFGKITLAASSTANEFNGNISVTNTSTAGVISIGSTAGTCSSTLASGKTLTAATFLQGSLSLYGFTQLGSTAQTLNLTNGVSLTIGSTGLGCTFNGPVNFSANYIQINASNFKSTSSFTQNNTSGSSSGSCTSAGGNTFDGDFTFDNSGMISLSLASTTGDTFNGNATYIQRRTYVSFSPMGASATNTYKGNLVLQTNATFSFPGKVIFNGNATQTISDPLGYSAPFTFNDITVNKTAGTLTLSVPISVTTKTTFTSGIVKTTATNYMNFASGATANTASIVSYVDGPVRKTGADAFTFPVGKGGIFRTIGISAPSTATDVFTAEFFNTPQAYGNSSLAPIAVVSNCEYWTLNRNAGTSNVFVTIGWKSSDCPRTYVTDPSTLLVSGWNGTKWASYGMSSPTGAASSGTITSSAALSVFGPIALASSSGSNPLPVTLTDFQAALINSSVKLSWETASEINNDHFTIERSEDGKYYHEIATVKGAGNKSSVSLYTYWDERATAGISYYRLKQTDFDGTTIFLGVRTIENAVDKATLNIYPNPVASAELIRTNYSGAAKILSLTGEEMLSVSNAEEMALPALAAGIYMIRTEDGRLAKFIVK